MTDTTKLFKKPWLAVDSQGQLAVFEAGQSGPVPESARESSKLLKSLLPEWLSKQAESRPVYTLEGRCEPGLTYPELHIPRAFEGRLGRTLVFFKSLEAQEQEAGSHAQAVPSVDAPALMYEDLDQGTAEDLHSLRLCRACFWPKKVESHDLQPARRGLFFYQHFTDGWASGPYGCLAQPDKARRLSDFEDEHPIHGHVVKLPGLCFGETARIHAPDHCPCDCPEFQILNLQGEPE